jgi:general secretion pathway protein J
MMKKREQGFTLLELLISLTILTMVTVIIGAGLRLAMNAWEKGDIETGETQKLRILSSMFSQQLKSVFPYMTEIDSEQVIVFEGDKNSILFVTTTDDILYGGLKWIRYDYKDETLYYKEGLLPDKELIDNIEGDEEILDSEIGEVTFEYFVAHTDEWRDSWDFDDSLPDAVKIKISYFQPFQVYLPYGQRFKNDEEESTVL